MTLTTAPPVLQSGIILNIKHDLQRLRTEEQELKTKYTDKHPKMIEVSKQIEDLHEALKKEVFNTYEVEKAHLNQLNAKKQSLEAEISKTQKKVDAIPDKDRELNEIVHKIDLLESKYEQLLQQQDRSMITLASNPDWQVVILSPASAPYQRKTKDYVRLALGPFLSLVVALGLAFFLESLDHSLNNVAEVEEYLGISVLTTISDIQRGK